jgi:hypothetical protein
MAGKHGSLWAYIHAYYEWGGRPPIPDDAEARRGSRRPGWHASLVSLAVLLLASVPVVFIISRLHLPASDEPLLLASFALLWVGLAFQIQMMLGLPLLDWYEDLPRHGVVDDAKPGLLSPEVLD